MTQYRYQLEKYRGRSTRHVCPQCGRKNVFTRYVDTENNNIYINDNVGKCNRLDKCGYHYTPKQYFTDNPWKSDGWSVGRNHRKPTDRPLTIRHQAILFRASSVRSLRWAKASTSSVALQPLRHLTHINVSSRLPKCQSHGIGTPFVKSQKSIQKVYFIHIYLKLALLGLLFRASYGYRFSL